MTNLDSEKEHRGSCQMLCSAERDIPSPSPANLPLFSYQQVYIIQKISYRPIQKPVV